MRAPAAQDATEPEVPCKYHAAGFCCYGARCRSSHDPHLVQRMEREWLAESCVQPRRELSLIPRSGVDRFVVLDLEGKEEIIELPAMCIDAHTMKETGRFHRWIRPVHLFDGKEINPDSTAVPFDRALREMETWLGGAARASRSLFVICGDWDIKTQIPKQCRLNGCELPMYFRRWANLKVLYNEKFGTSVRGMKGMLGHQGMLGRNGEVDGVHHLGMHDVTNIARILVRLAESGADLDATGEVDASGRVTTRWKPTGDRRRR